MSSVRCRQRLRSQLRRIDNEQVRWLLPDPTQPFSATAFTDPLMVALGLGASLAAARGRPARAGREEKAAQGLDRRTIMFKYLLRPSVIPSVSLMGLQFAALFGNAFLVELIFNWPGIGYYALTSIISLDYTALMGVTMMIGREMLMTAWKTVSSRDHIQFTPAQRP